MTQPATDHVSGSTTFLTYDPPIAGTKPVPAGVLVDVDGNILDGRTRVVTATPTVSTSAYAAKDAMGSKLTFAGAVESAASAADLVGVTVLDKGQAMPTLELVLFNQDFTASSDNAIFNPSDADLANAIAAIKLGSDWADFSGNSLLAWRGVQPLKLTGTSLYGQLVVRGTPTLASTSDIVVTVFVRGN